MRGDSRAPSFRGDECGHPRAALPQAQPAGAGSAPATSLPGLGRRGGYKEKGERGFTEQERPVLRAPNARTRPQLRQPSPLDLGLRASLQVPGASPG